MSQHLLILDLDGTMIDSRRDLASAVNLVRRHYGLPDLPVEQVVGFIGDGVRNLIRRSLAGISVDLDEAVDLQRKFYREHMYDETTLYPGVEKGLRELNTGGCVLAAASNKMADSCERILEHFGIRDLFQQVSGDGTGVKLKPHPEMFLRIMAKAGMPADKTWAIGDNHTDLEAARRAGIKSIFLTYGFGSAGTEKPDKVCSSFDEFVGMFR